MDPGEPDRRQSAEGGMETVCDVIVTTVGIGHVHQDETRPRARIQRLPLLQRLPAFLTV